MRSRTGQLLASSFVVAMFAAGTAEAAPPGPAPGPAPAQQPKASSSQFALRREEAGGSDGTAARQRARAGDCAGALLAFDSAIRVTIEPTLRRDRGLCHEKLESPYPAMEDYRAYLVARPDAPDADQIRERLARLEEQTGTGGPSSQSVKEREGTAGGSAAGASFSLGGKGTASTSTRASSSSTASGSGSNTALGPRPGEQERGYDYYATQEKLAESAESSPLRLGTGWIVGPFLMLPRYFIGEGASKDLGYAVGAAVRYSFSSSTTFISELGYTGVGNSGEGSSSGGPLVFAGLELRMPLDRWASNQLVLGAGPGFERYTVSGSQVGINVYALRGRFGFRHVFGPSVGLEALLDGGPTYYKPTGVDGLDGRFLAVVGASVAFVVGF